MNSSIRALRPLGTSFIAMIVFTLILGVGYPLIVTGIGQLLFPNQANGSLVTNSSGETVGSSLIGQSFTDSDGNALVQYFQSRPSAADYDAMASTGSNLGPNSDKLLNLIDQRRDAIIALEGVDASQIPADALTASGSGLDPDISLAYAELQVPRIAQARNISEDTVRSLINDAVEPRPLGNLQDEVVNVLTLNLALDQLTS